MVVVVQVVVVVALVVVVVAGLMSGLDLEFPRHREPSPPLLLQTHLLP